MTYPNRYDQNIKDTHILFIPAHWHGFPPGIAVRSFLFGAGYEDQMFRGISWDSDNNIIMRLNYDSFHGYGAAVTARVILCPEPNWDPNDPSRNLHIPRQSKEPQ
jgi:hypothetical protein